MADIIAIAGDTGSGKTSGVRSLNPKETFVISILGKALPFKGSKKNYINAQQFITLKKEEHLMNETPKSLLIFLKVYKAAALPQAQ